MRSGGVTTRQSGGGGHGGGGTQQTANGNVLLDALVKGLLTSGQLTTKMHFNLRSTKQTSCHSYTVIMTTNIYKQT